MGRPSLKVTATIVRLQNGVAELIDAMVGKNRRSEFIREAVKEKLERAGVTIPEQAKRS